jgi:TatA/E family protein of Tat protein translocase
LFSSVGPTEILVVLIIALLVFGPQKLPEVGRSIGRGLREFRRASDEVKEQLLGGLDDEPAFPASSPNGAEGGADAPAAGSVERFAQGSDGPSAGAATAKSDGEGTARLPADGTE